MQFSHCCATDNACNCDCFRSRFPQESLFAWQLCSLNTYRTARRRICICCVHADKQEQFLTALKGWKRTFLGWGTEKFPVLFALCHHTHIFDCELSCWYLTKLFFKRYSGHKHCRFCINWIITAPVTTVMSSTVCFQYKAHMHTVFNVSVILFDREDSLKTALEMRIFSQGGSTTYYQLLLFLILLLLLLFYSHLSLQWLPGAGSDWGHHWRRPEADPGARVSHQAVGGTKRIKNLHVH